MTELSTAWMLGCVCGFFLGVTVASRRRPTCRELMRDRAPRQPWISQLEMRNKLFRSSENALAHARAAADAEAATAAIFFCDTKQNASTYSELLSPRPNDPRH